MASSRKTLNPMTDTPTNKLDITKPFMLAYIKSEKATPADIEWFKSVVSNPANRKEYTNRLSNEKYEDINIPVVRKLFCQRFYPNILETKKKNKSFIDEIMAL